MDFPRHDDGRLATSQPHSFGARQGSVQPASKRRRLFAASHSALIRGLVSRIAAAAGRRSLRLAVALILTGAIPGFTQDVKFPVDGTIIKASPIFWLRDTTRSPIILLPAGTA